MELTQKEELNKLCEKFINIFSLKRTICGKVFPIIGIKTAQYILLILIFNNTSLKLTESQKKECERLKRCLSITNYEIEHKYINTKVINDYAVALGSSIDDTKLLFIDYILKNLII